MTALIRMQNARLAFGAAPLLDKTQLTIHAGERVCIVGRNGAGKSTLLKVLEGSQLLDEGDVQFISGLKVGRLPQDPPKQKHSQATVFDYVAGAFENLQTLLSEHARVLQKMAQKPESTELLTQLSRIQEELDANQGWEIQQQIEHTLTRLNLQGDLLLRNLSGGWLRRVALARAWVGQPDVLLLDEPTNHLDVETILWLEDTLKEFRGALVFISHDRAFIRAMATRIVDLDRGHLQSFPGDYDAYLVEKAHLLEVEETHNQAFDKKLAEEEAWIRQGIKARRTRNEGRVRALKALREEHKQRRQKQGSVSFETQEAERSGRVVWEAKQLSFYHENAQNKNKPLVKDFDFSLLRGDKVALVGPNGCGKSTLIKLILGELTPTSGTSKQGTNLNVAYYDQHRADLDPEKSIADNVGDGKQDVTFGGRTRHIYSYLQDFLFSPQQARMPVKSLSGGERNRVLLAKILLREANLLVLDEPTNDLDVETLELLESIIAEYSGTVLLVSHDRAFIENTATSVLLFEGQGKITEIIGGFNEVALYQREKEAAEAARLARINKAQEGTKRAEQDSQQAVLKKQSSLARSSKKLSYNETRELAQLPEKIEALEEELTGLQHEISDVDFFKKPVEETQPVLNRIQEIETELEHALERWDYLESF